MEKHYLDQNNMEKHYLDQILEIFKDERDVKFTITNNYVPQVTELFV